MSISDLETAVGMVRTALETVTLANGYPITIKDAGGSQDENPFDTPPSRLPKAWVYLPGDGVGGNITDLGTPSWGKGSVTALVNIDVWYASTDSEEEVFKYLGSIHKALRSMDHGAVSFKTATAGEWQFMASPRRCMVRLPIKITAWMKENEV